MKKIVVIVVMMLLFPMKVSAISAESMIAMDADSKRVLYAHNIEREKLIASTTKIMTAIIALENASLDSKITVGEEVLKAHGSAIYIEMGEEISLRDLLYGLMLRSGNDAAIEIAYLVTGGMDSFAYLMNQKAYELGMNQTIFYNNHGLEENNGKGNTSTAYDMALLMTYALENEEFVRITGTEDHVAKTNQKTYKWENKNRLLREYEYTISGKTGYTEKAKRTLVTAAEKDSKKIVVVTLNDGNDFQDHKDMYETLFSKYKRVTALSTSNLSIEQPTKGVYYIEKDFSLLVTEAEENEIKIVYDLQSKKDYENNEQVGIAKVMLGDKEVGSRRVYIKYDEEQKEEKVGLFRRFLGWLFKW